VLVWTIERKIQRLELRKEKILDIIKDAQREYFQDGKMSEGIFNIKTKKLAELIRDIDRQIPMLRERLAELGKRENFNRELKRKTRKKFSFINLFKKFRRKLK